VATLTVWTAIGQVLGHVTVTYEADITADVVQVYGRQLDAACSAMLRQSLITPPLLDDLLTSAVFNDARSSAHDLPLRAFELLFESAKYVSSGNRVRRFSQLLSTAACIFPLSLDAIKTQFYCLHNTWWAKTLTLFWYLSFLFC